MAEDRTKPHPRYALVGPSQLGSWSISIIVAELDWPPSKQIAADRSWLHADAIRREGYMMALDAVQVRVDNVIGRCGSGTKTDAGGMGAARNIGLRIDELRAKAPGEAE